MKRRPKALSWWIYLLNTNISTWLIEEEVSIETNEDDWLFDGIGNDSVEDLNWSWIFFSCWIWFCGQNSDAHDSKGVSEEVKGDSGKDGAKDGPLSCLGRQVQSWKITEKDLIEAVARVSILDHAEGG